MNKLSVGESKPHKWKIGAAGIMAVECTDHSHTFISWKDQLGLRWVAEAKGSGVRMVSNIEFKQVNQVTNIFDYEVTDEQLNKAIRFVWTNLPVKYAFKQIAGLFEMRIVNFLYRCVGSKRRANNRFRDGDFSQICSEFAVRTVETATGVKAPGILENYGLIETHAFNMKHGKQKEQAIIDKINNK